MSHEPSVNYVPSELTLATRNAGIPLEALKHAITPVGLHYLLGHYDIPVIDSKKYALEINGKVGKSLKLTLDDIKSRPKVTQAVTLECAGNGRSLVSPRKISQPWIYNAVGTYEWTGTPLGPILKEAGIGDGAVDVVFTGMDKGMEGVLQYYQRKLTVAQAMEEQVMLAYEMNGIPLLPQHGAPLRLVVPGWYGMASVKWLARIEVVDFNFNGPQQQSYTFRQSSTSPRTEVTEISVRSLMVPPGIPTFLKRHRLVTVGTVEITGRAWAGSKAITKVEFSSDNGATWKDATIEKDSTLSKYAWTGWSVSWDAKEGDCVLRCRATDDAGNVQPEECEWNYGGYAVNPWQKVIVKVVPKAELELNRDAKKW